MWEQLISKIAAGETLTPEELETLQSGHRETEAERDAARSELGELRFRHKVTELAAKHRFADPEYLAFLCRRRNLEPAMEQEFETFMAELKDQSPRLFRIDVKPGIAPVSAPAADPEPASVADMLMNAPEVK